MFPVAKKRFPRHIEQMKKQPDKQDCNEQISKQNFQEYGLEEGKRIMA
jgi:hypothetical protein